MQSEESRSQLTESVIGLGEPRDDDIPAVCARPAPLEGALTRRRRAGAAVEPGRSMKWFGAARRANRPVGAADGHVKGMAKRMGKVNPSGGDADNLEAVERTLAALSGGKENDAALGLDTVLVKGVHDMAIDEAIARAASGKERRKAAAKGKGHVNNRKGPTVSVPNSVKTPAAVRALVAKALAGKVLSKREQDQLRSELERREGAAPANAANSSPFTPPPVPMNTPTGAGVARRYPAMTCGDTNETNDTDASPPFAMTPTLLAEAARLAMRNAGTGKGPANPLGRALAAGERREPLTSTQRNILDAVEELRCGKILPLERMKLLEWAQTDDDDDALIEVSRPMPSPSTVASLCAATFGILPLTPPSDDEASDGSYASDEVFSFDAKNKVEGEAAKEETTSPEPWISPVQFNRGKSMTPTLEEMARRKESGEALTEGEDAMVSMFKLASPAR